MIQVNIGRHQIGQGQPCFIIAEIGSNHNNDFATALKLIDAAKEAGADAVKFQTFKADKHYSTKTPDFTYLKENTYQLIKKLELPREWQKELKQYCDSIGVVFLSSPCDEEAIDQLDELGMEAFKIASFDMVDLHLLEYMAKKNKPVIVSTGMADYEDILDAVKVMQNANNNKLIFLQCTSLYPAPPELSNLKSMQVIENMFGYPCGYSDHTLGNHISVAAVALGAKVIEKHFTLDKNAQGPDHKFAIEPHEFKALIQSIRDVEEAIGTGYKLGPAEAEKEMHLKGRRSIMAAAKIQAGTIITKEMLTIKRPGYGIKPKYFELLIGREAKNDIDADSWITWDLIK